MIRRYLIAAAAICGAMTLITGCSDKPVKEPPATSTTPPPAVTEPATATDTAIEAFRLMVAESESGYQAQACTYFAPDAYLISSVETGSTIPASRWCAPAAEPLPPAQHAEKDRTPVVQEEVKVDDNERWVRLTFAANEQRQRIVALTEEEGRWTITRWCAYGTTQSGREEGGDDPFYCLKATQ